MSQPVVLWEILAMDAGRTREFYEKLFEWKIDVDVEMNYGVVESSSEGGGINGGIGTALNGMPAVTFFVQVDDLEAYLSRAERLGGTIVAPPTTIPRVGSAAWFSDPEGNVIGLFSNKPQSVRS